MESTKTMTRVHLDRKQIFDDVPQKMPFHELPKLDLTPGQTTPRHVSDIIPDFEGDLLDDQFKAWVLTGAILPEPFSLAKEVLVDLQYVDLRPSSNWQ